MIANCDVVSIHCPLNDETRGLFDRAVMEGMKPEAILVNTARGGIVEEAALVAALRSGKLGAAGLDVFEHEPPAADHPLKAFDQVILSPHIAGVTEGASERMAIGSAQNILDFFAGTIDPALVVNRKELENGVKA